MVIRLVKGAFGAVVAIGLVASLGACNTVEGFGKDMSAAGRALSNAAVRDKGSSTASSSNATEATRSTASNAPTTSVTPKPLN